MPASSADRTKRTRDGNQRESLHRKPAQEQTPSSRKADAAEAGPLPEALSGGDFSPRAFEQHADLLGDPRMSRPMYGSQRAAILRRLQRDYGNQYVQRLVEHITTQRRGADGPHLGDVQKDASADGQEIARATRQNGPAAAVADRREIQQQPAIPGPDAPHAHPAWPGIPLIQRHSSWEHRMLGDVTPDALAIIGAGRDAKGRDSVDMEVLEGGQKGKKTVTREEILHTIEQEIKRIEYFRDNPPKSASKEEAERLSARESMDRAKEALDEGGTAEQAKAEQESEDKKWQVRLLSIPLKDGSTEAVTYGEMNTLADFYGSLNEIKETDPENFRGILKGVRQQSLFKLMDLYEEVSGTTKYQDLAEQARKEKRGKEGVLKGAARVGGGALGGAVGLGVGAVGGAVGGIVKGAKAGWEKGGGGVGGAILGGLGAIGGAIASPVTAVIGAGKGAKKGAEMGFKGPGLEQMSKYAGLGFEGAIGSTGATGGKMGGTIGELRNMGTIPGYEGKKPVEGKESTTYTAGLARNACHFAPESWHAWADAHRDAIKLAKEAYEARQSAEVDQERIKLLLEFGLSPESEEVQRIQEEAAKSLAESEQKSNEAYLANGFGDHFLQDSYAAGHLINKTQIMQWYVEYIDKAKTWDYHLDENWRKAQNMAYAQPGLADKGQYDKASVDKSDSNPNRREASNPQSVANKTEGQGWEAIHDALGLQVPSSLGKDSDSLKLLMWWQKDTLERYKITQPRKKTIKTIIEDGPFPSDKDRVAKALGALYFDGIIRLDKYKPEETQAAFEKGSRTVPLKATVVLRDSYVPSKKQKAEFLEMTGAIQGNQQGEEEVSEAERDEAYEKYVKKAKGVTYKEYEGFMRSSFIQKSTNALHDRFCQEGLDVYAGKSESVFKIYGDDAMLQKESSAGVKHSAETARMSVNAIDDVIQKGTESGDRTTSKIVDRFPENVHWDGAKISLADWHNEGTLKDWTFKNVFPEMAWGVTQKLAPGVLGSDLGKLFEAESPHGSEAF
ncbi:MAG: hypothetical protein L0177_06100 [Chloroflexi bacterium]|nr:hypothetical protein [Chloroflexota bacterium]